MTEHPKKRRGLVLAGGGAKGAYAFGCLKALREKGFSFEAVSGTSVGALNALLWSADRSDKLEIGTNLWSQISFHRVYPLKLLNRFRRLPSVVLYMVATCYVFLRLFVSACKGDPVPYRAVWLTPLIFLAALPGLFFGYPDTLDAFWFGMFLGVLGWIALLKNSKSSRGPGTSAIFMEWGIVILIISCAIVIGFGEMISIVLTGALEWALKSANVSSNRSDIILIIMYTLLIVVGIYGVALLFAWLLSKVDAVFVKFDRWACSDNTALLSPNLGWQRMYSV